MPENPKVGVRLSPTHRRLLQRLCVKLGLDQANVLRLALSRLAEAEGVLPESPKQ